MLEFNDPWPLGSLPLSWEAETVPCLAGKSSPDTADLKYCHFPQKTAFTKCLPFPCILKFGEKDKKFYKEQKPCFLGTSSPVTLFDKSPH